MQGTGWVRGNSNPSKAQNPCAHVGYFVPRRASGPIPIIFTGNGNAKNINLIRQ